MAAGLFQDVFVATDDRTIRCTGLKLGEEKGIYVGHTQLITQIHVPPSGYKFVSLQWDGQVLFWLVGQGEPVETEVASSPIKGVGRLPKLLRREMERKAQSWEEPMISLYEKQRKTLLLKRREGEKQLKMMKKSSTWRKITQIKERVASAMREAEAKIVPEKHEKSKKG
jgi:WD40 repeat protein